MPRVCDCIHRSAGHHDCAWESVRDEQSSNVTHLAARSATLTARWGPAAVDPTAKCSRGKVALRPAYTLLRELGRDSPSMHVVTILHAVQCFPEHLRLVGLLVVRPRMRYLSTLR